MRITGNETATAVMEELGTRLKAYRISIPMTQAELAEEAGVAMRTITRLEAGDTVRLDNFLNVLRVMGLMNNIEAIVPQDMVRPSDMYNLGKSRQRAMSAKYRVSEKTSDWVWGEDK